MGLFLIEISDMKPMIDATSLVDGRDKMPRKNPHSLVAIAIHRNAAGRCCSKVDHGDRRCVKMIIVPTIDCAAELAIVLKNSDRWSVENPTPYHNLLAIPFALNRNAFARRISQRTGMNEAYVRRIAEIIR